MTDLFADVIGHGGVVELLRSELEHPAQAYLFVGPQSVGKEFVALRFATGLLGGATDERTRRLALMRAHPDLTVLEPEGATSLGVDQAREVVARASLAPVEAPRTVFFFPDAGSMTEQAANALLKTLETCARCAPSAPRRRTSPSRSWSRTTHRATSSATSPPSASRRRSTAPTTAWWTARWSTRATPARCA
jgi:DNA polymerase-3 subunit delta'